MGPYCHKKITVLYTMILLQSLMHPNFVPMPMSNADEKHRQN